MMPAMGRYRGVRVAGLLLLAFVVAACKSGEPGYIKGATPTPRFAQATPTGPRADSLRDKATPLCEAAFAARVTEGTVEGPLLFLQHGNYIKAALDRMPNRPPAWEATSFHGASFVVAQTVEQVRSLACVRETRVQVGTYVPASSTPSSGSGGRAGGGLPAYRLDWQVRLARWPDGTVIAATELRGTEPGEKITVNERTGPSVEGYGSSPDNAFKAWLSGRLRQPGVLLHPAAVRAAAFTPDGARVATAAEDGKVRLWDGAAGRLLATLDGHKGKALSVAVSPDGRLLASGGEDGAVRLWDIASGKPARTLDGLAGAVRTLAWAPDGASLAGADDKHRVIAWDAATGQQARSFDAGVTVVAFSRDLSLAAGVREREFLSDKPGGVALFEMSSGKEQRALQLKREHPVSIAFSPDGATVAAVPKYGNYIYRWTVANSKEAKPLVVDGYFGEGLAFAPDGAALAAGVSVTGRGQGAWLWDANEAQPLRSLTGHFFKVTVVGFAPNGQTLLTAGDDGVVKLWNLATGE
ncbi:MAG: WD40 repeat domain-containing protein [Dehalococcoidia bacterium]